MKFRITYLSASEDLLRLVAEEATIELDPITSPMKIATSGIWVSASKFIAPSAILSVEKIP